MALVPSETQSGPSPAEMLSRLRGLLDREKAHIAPRTEDVAHFLPPTTTLWRD